MLTSGGVDSAVLVVRLAAQGRRVLPVYLRCGFRWETAELYWARRWLRAVRATPAGRRVEALRVIEFPIRSLYGTHWGLTGRRVPSAGSADNAVYLPGRNVVLVGSAAILCAQRKVDTIALGVLKGNPFPDASPQFFRGFSSSLSRALRRPLRIRTPLRRVRKARLIRSARGVPLGLTFSCLRPRGLDHCGRCNKCAERMRAFAQSRVADPTRYR